MRTTTTWSASLEAWRNDVSRLTGNLVEVLEVDAHEATTKLGGHGQVWNDIRRDGRVVHGRPIDGLRLARTPRNRAAQRVADKVR